MLLSRMTIATKLPVFVVGLALVSGAVTGVIAYLRAEQALEDAAFNKLEAVRDGRVAQLDDYLGTIAEDLTVLSESSTVQQALMGFRSGWDIVENPQETLQELYIHDNPHPAGRRDELDTADDGSMYSRSHNRLHPWFRRVLHGRGYNDIFLLSPEGDLVYSVLKKVDYATNLLDGAWASTDLGRAFQAARDNAEPGYRVFFDFRAYAPSEGAPAGFMAAPVLDNGGRLLGVLAVQMPIARINEIMQRRTGMGETGESYLVGPDNLMRSDSRFSSDSVILEQRVDTEPVRLALRGERGVMVTTDYRDVEVLSAYEPFDFMGTTWAVLAEIDMAEVEAPAVHIRNLMLIATAVVMAVIAGIGLALARSISAPITRMTKAMAQLSRDDLEVEVPARDRHDEIGAMATAVQVFKDNALEMKRLQAERREEELRVEAEKQAAMRRMADDFETGVSHIVEGVSSAATEMQSTAGSMSAIAEETSSQARTVASAAEQASANVQTVAAATEELGSSIAEIARQVQSQTEMATDAADAAKTSDRQVKSLAEQAQAIGEVVDLITAIAEQTNMLALNATIEAARAGDAGKGFSVVASEVKNLANQTAKATEKIAGQIKAIQDQTDSTVQAIDLINEKILAMTEVSTAVASGVEEQNAATGEIGRNVQQAATGTQQVSGAIVGVNQAAQEAGSSANQVLSAASQLSEQAAQLSAQVKRFIEQIRAA